MARSEIQRRKQPPSMLELCEIFKRRREQMWGPIDDDMNEGNSSFRRTEETSSGQQMSTERKNDQRPSVRRLVLVTANQRPGSSGYESRAPPVIAVSESRLRSALRKIVTYQAPSVNPQSVNSSGGRDLGRRESPNKAKKNTREQR